MRRRYSVRSVGLPTHDEFHIVDLVTAKVLLIVDERLDPAASRRTAEDIADDLNRYCHEWEHRKA
jgi:hypothetical protein